MITETLRRCPGYIGIEYSKTAHETPESEFLRTKNRSTGFVARCNECRRARDREYSKRYQRANAAKVAAKVRNWRAKRAQS